jgi:hypothetical protein
LSPSVVARFPWAIGRREVLLVFLAAVALYVGSFFLVQKRNFFTYHCETRKGSAVFRFISVEARFFSKDPVINDALYLVYWPIHRWIMPHADSVKPFNYCDEFPREPVYLRDVRGLHAP